jgi:peptidoglycan-associated lipoprotein
VVYFDLDRSDVRPEDRPVVEAHAGYLAASPSTSVILEGHADERGSREYNLALGERRAISVRQLMTVLGVSNDQIQVVSFGEEKPAVEGYDESAWALNRRVEFTYPRW